VRGVGDGPPLDVAGALAEGGARRAADAAGRAKDAEALVRTARELEGVFLGMVFEAMAQGTGQDDGLFPETPGREMFEGWFRTEVATLWAAGGGPGLGDTIARAMAGAAGVTLPPAGSAPVPSALPPRPSAPRPVAPRAQPAPAAVALGPPAPLEVPAAARGPMPAEGRISSTFGHRAHPVHGGADFHRGIDIAVPVGSPVRTPFDGVVTEVGSDALLGVKVVIEHKGGFRSVYGHNSRADVQVGQAVRAGELVARSGATGRATGPHLHFALYRDGAPVDPLPWLDAPRAR
jgi:Rod binding domain-containing protein